jgi:arsenite methyltransferase
MGGRRDQQRRGQPLRQKRAIFSEILRVLRPGGHLQFADIANGKPVPEAAIQNIDLWTA